jgi:hypothetical protein
MPNFSLYKTCFKRRDSFFEPFWVHLSLSFQTILRRQKNVLLKRQYHQICVRVYALRHREYDKTNRCEVVYDFSVPPLE